MKRHGKKQLQVALDFISLQDALYILSDVSAYVDVIEVGTPLLMAEGAAAVRVIKEHYPEKIVFADTKVIDGGSLTPVPELDAGADMVSVLGLADNSTIQKVIEISHETGKKVLVDLCMVRNLTERAHAVEAFRPDYICVHVGSDRQCCGDNPIRKLEELSGISCKRAVAGGIQLKNFDQIVGCSAELIIVGSAICQSDEPGSVACKMRNALDAFGTSSGV